MQIDILQLAGIITAIGIIGGALFAIFSFYVEHKNLKKEIKALKKENTLLCYCLAACLDGLNQLGANGTVSEASKKMSKYLNLAAHDEDE
ncbi:MAG: branched-chain amino acid ABC transporter permease [Ruminococcus sp.]|nr:branched-chain amino acid ABC transporter permease [Ruminococcus sp.]